MTAGGLAREQQSQAAPAEVIGTVVRVSGKDNQFVVRTAARDRLRTHLAARGIATLIHYPRALHELQAFEGCGRVTEPLREATRAAAEVLSLPIYPELPLAVLRAVIAAVNAFV